MEDKWKQLQDILKDPEVQLGLYTIIVEKVWDNTGSMDEDDAHKLSETSAEEIIDTIINKQEE
jgi:hypothetical protein